MEAVFYNFAKRQNSTKVPAGNAGTTFNVTLKQPTSMNDPVLRLSADTFGFNYAAFNGSYYFISDIHSIRNNLWDVYLTRDVLATYRDQILSQSLYVTRSYSQYDGYIMDMKYPAKVDYTVQETSVTAPWDASLDFSSGTYICGIVGAPVTGSVGSVTYWALTLSELRAMLSELMASIDWYNVDAAEISKALQRMLFNPMQYFVSCTWLPFAQSNFSGSNGVQIKYGWWVLDATGKMLNSTAPIRKASYLQLLPHPQTIRGSYLNSAPYTRKIIRYMPFGTFEIDPQFFPSNTTVVLYTSVDIVTGAGILRVAKEAGDNWLNYQTIEAQIGVPIQLSQQAQNFGKTAGAITALAGTAAAILSGGTLATVAAGSAAAITSGAAAAVPALQSTGINGGIAGLDPDITCTHMFSIIADEDLVDIGRPLCKYVQLGTLSGFTQCETGALSLQCMAQERTQIENYLREGFYIE